MLFRFRPSANLSRLTALLALWAMLVPLWTMVAHHPAMPPAEIEKCAMAGMMAIQMPAPSPEKAPKSKPVCPVCQTLAQLGLGFIAPVLPVLYVVQVAVSDIVFTGDTLHLASFWPYAGRPRGPPLSA